MKRLALALAVLTVTGPAHATYSIVATDSATGQVGGAGTSCVGSMSVYIIYGSAPGHGAVHAQAYVNEAGRDEAARLLGLDTPPDDILAAITNPSFDSNASFRQYGIADLSGRAAGFTGVANGSYANDAQGSVSTFTYSVQGNILTSGVVLDQAATGFEGEGCDLADRLMLALEAGAVGGEGDSRCTASGIPSDSAFIHVDLVDGSDYLHISVTDSAPASPLIELRAQYDVWRASHHCPVPTDDVPDASTDALVDPLLDPVEDLATEPSGDPIPDPGADAAHDPALDAEEEDGGRLRTGCGCTTAGARPATAPLAILLLLAAALRGRRRR